MEDQDAGEGFPVSKEGTHLGAQDEELTLDGLQRVVNKQTSGHSEVKSDTLKLWQWIVLILFSPLAGFIGWITWRKSQPKKAHMAVIVAVVMLSIGLLFIAPLLVKIYIVQPYLNPANSMAPTIMPGDRVLVNKFVYWFSNPKPGDIIVFKAPGNTENLLLMKRIVAINGQTIEIRDSSLFINGKKTSESYLSPSSKKYSFESMIVPKDTVFVLGDNRPNSVDSRIFGPIPKSTILGKVFMIYWPLTLRPGQSSIL